MPVYPRPVVDRLMEKTIPEPNSGCWIWLGVVRNSGYGLIGVGSDVDGTRTMKSVHRVAYEEFVGEIPTGLYVLHRCDNKLCVNPEHLFVGTQADNMRDMHIKGRNYWGGVRRSNRPSNNRRRKQWHTL